jgi:putative addiction module CopG family antidote
MGGYNEVVPTQPLNVNVPEDLAQFVEEQTEGAGYATSSDVVREGLRLLRDRSRARTALARLLDNGRADVGASPTRPFNEAFLDGVIARGVDRRK